MINVRLLGGVKKAVGKPSIVLEESTLPLSEILMVLRRKVKEPEALNPHNILIAVNGVESSSLGGNDTVIMSGDIVTIVTVVHGGSPKPV
ncbi:MAG TPA: MoaD/ThiS family protein [Candidatus Nitrosopolaris sp.]|nr:MoaD/ThiS family protein [Candidatus Nitrosopolaris sp.]